MDNKLEKIVSWAKRRGFVMPGSEIYGGLSGVYDFGPYGTALKNNIKKLWWKTFVDGREDIVGIESAILMSHDVWYASGHESSFIDEMVECKKCHKRFKLDDMDSQKCENGGEHDLTAPKAFNAMFKTHVGVIKDDTSMTYLRPETAQGMFTDFKYIMETSRQKIPFGIAQFGKCFRNEINTKDFLFRVREFEIAEIEYFVKSPKAKTEARPGNIDHERNDDEWFDYWLNEWEKFVLSLGIKKENIKIFEHEKTSLSHYSKKTVDIQYNYPFGWKELTGLANRTDFDLDSHMEASGKDLNYFDPETSEKYIPYVIEPTLGIERLMLAVICEAYEEFPNGRNEKNIIASEAKQSIKNNKIAASPAAPRNDNLETVLHFNKNLAPVKVAVLPLVKKISKEAREIYDDIKSCYNDIEFDESGSIGRRYRRQDEIGTPYCITYDFDTEKDKKVTVRDRDSMKQERIAISDLKNYLFEKLN